MPGAHAELRICIDAVAAARRPASCRLDRFSNMVDISSTMKEEQPASLNDRIAARVRDLRAARGLSLDALAAHAASAAR